MQDSLQLFGLLLDFVSFESEDNKDAIRRGERAPVKRVWGSLIVAPSMAAIPYNRSSQFPNKEKVNHPARENSVLLLFPAWLNRNDQPGRNMIARHISMTWPSSKRDFRSNKQNPWRLI